MSDDRGPYPPIVEHVPAPHWKLVLVVLAAAFAFWQLRDMPPGPGTPAERRPARAAPMPAAVTPQRAVAARPQPGFDPRAPESVMQSPRAGVQDAVLQTVGLQFESLAALDTHLRRFDFARVGRFGEDWPASVVQARTGYETLELEHAGQRHRYTGFDNVDLVALTLAGDAGTPVTVVYRRLREPPR